MKYLEIKSRLILWCVCADDIHPIYINIIYLSAYPFVSVRA